MSSEVEVEAPVCGRVPELGASGLPARLSFANLTGSLALQNQAVSTIDYHNHHFCTFSLESLIKNL